MMNFLKLISIFTAVITAAPVPGALVQKRAVQTVTNTVVVTTVVANGQTIPSMQTIKATTQAPLIPEGAVIGAETNVAVATETTTAVQYTSTSEYVPIVESTEPEQTVAAETTAKHGIVVPQAGALVSRPPQLLPFAATATTAAAASPSSSVFTEEIVSDVPETYVSTAPSVAETVDTTTFVEDSVVESSSSSSSVYVSSAPSQSSSSASAATGSTGSTGNSNGNYQTPPADDGHKSYYDFTMYDPAAEGLTPLSDSNGNAAYKEAQAACAFPWANGNSDHVVAITPGSMNGGWAMSPDTKCQPGMWCPYACDSGYYSAQWDPKSAQQEFSKLSMHGGLYCDTYGKLWVPRKSEPFCRQGAMNTFIRNQLNQSVAACQTVYPGSEAMIIPTVAGPGQTEALNIVPADYWCNTSSDFYVQLAGSSDAQCIWGTESSPVGNWGPYIFGGRLDGGGNTYISVKYNPLYVSRGFSKSDAYNVRIECSVEGGCDFPMGGKCQCENGQCSLADGCTVAVKPGAQAYYVLY